MFQRLLFSLSILLSTLSGYTQRLQPEVQFLGFCDNREYYNTVHNYSQTFLGVALLPGLAYQIEKDHFLHAGIALNKDAGTSPLIDKAQPLISYQYRTERTRFNMGIFSRDTLLKEYPLFLLNDTLNYYRPTLQGMYLALKKNNLQAKVWMDWQQKIDSFQKEAFLYGFAVKWQKGIISFNTKSTLYHLANAFVRSPTDHIHGQFANYSSLGIHLRPQGFLSELNIAAGPMYAADVHRTYYAHYPWGLLTELELKHKNIFLKNTYYRGQGFDLVFGDSFYRSTEYDRLDAGILFGKGTRIQGKFTYSLHFIEQRINHQQALTVRCLI